MIHTSSWVLSGLSRLQALQVFTWMQRAAVGCTATAALSSAAAVGAGQSSATVWGSIAAAAALSAVAAWRIQMERRNFLFNDYVPAER